MTLEGWGWDQQGAEQAEGWSVDLSVLPRRSQISRGMAGTGQAEQVLAANVDKVWIVHGLDTLINLRRIERYMAVVWESGASPEIALTKTDLAANLDSEIADLQGTAIGVPIKTVRGLSGSFAGTDAERWSRQAALRTRPTPLGRRPLQPDPLHPAQARPRLHCRTQNPTPLGVLDPSHPPHPHSRSSLRQPQGPWTPDPCFASRGGGPRHAPGGHSRITI